MATYKVIHYTGELNTSSTSSSIPLEMMADKLNAFWISDLKEDTIATSGTTKEITWLLKDEKENLIPSLEKKGNWEKQYIFSLDKKMCGEYVYSLEASFLEASSGAIETATALKIKGSCAPKIIKADTNLPDTLDQKTATNKSGNQIQIYIEAEGLNGVELICEAEFGTQKFNTKTTCVEGDATFEIKFPMQSIKGTKPVTNTLKVRIKDPNGNYIDYAGNEIVLEKDVTIDPKAAPINITNKTVSSIYQHSTIKPEVNGILELDNLKFDTDIIIVNDTFTYDVDYYNKWVLVSNVADKTNSAKYKHWIKQRLPEDKDLKPEVIPVPFVANEDIKIKANFKCNVDITNAEVKVVSSESSCIFSLDSTGIRSKGSTLFELEFNAIKPFKTIRHIPNFELTFEYKPDGLTTWMLLGKMKFCLYITKDQPIQSLTNKLLHESLFDIGCRQCEGKNETDIDTDEKIIDLIFTEFEKSNLKVLRTRELSNIRPNGIDEYLAYPDIKGIGYWRGATDIPRPDTTFDLSRPHEYAWGYALAGGEGRCGPITDLFLEILMIQGVSVNRTNGTVGICTYFAYKEFSYSNSYTEQYPKKRKKKNIKSAYFAVKDAVHDDKTNARVVKDRSKALGNDNANPVFFDHFWFFHSGTDRFFDPSYGCKYSKAESKFKTYCKDNISSMLVETKKKPDNSTDQYTEIEGSASMAGFYATPATVTAPVMFGDAKNMKNPDIIKDYLHHYIWSTRNLFE